MRIRQLLVLIAGLTIIGVFFAGMAVFWTTERLVDSSADQRQTQLVSRQMASLLVLTEEFVLDHSERTIKQWWLRHREIADNLKATHNDSTLLGEIREQHQRLGKLFASITDAPSNLDPDLAQRRMMLLLGQLTREVEAIGEQTYRWGADMEATRSASERLLTGVVVALGGIFMATLLVVILVAHRRLIRPLSRLEEAARAVGNGDLDQHLPETGQDEFANLSRAFNLMTRSLSTQSHDLLAINRALQEETKLAEQARRSVETLLQHSPDAMIVVDAKGVVVRANDRAHALFGYPASGLLGISIEHLVPHNLRDRHQHLRHDYTRRPQTNSMTTNPEISALRFDGSTFDVEINLSQFAVDQSVGTIATVRDVTERRRVESAMASARDMAEAASRAKSEFVANMSHEIRTPMNAVLGMAHLLAETPLSAEQHQYVEMINASGQSLLAVLSDILDFSKIEAGRLEINSHSFRLQTMLNLLATIMAANCGEKRIELVIGVEPDVPDQLHGDMERLQQVLVNLLGNAIKFTPSGEVVLSVEALQRDDQHVELRFTVRDSGIGIAADQQAHLFQAFTQADASTTRRFGGTGLGLVISKRLTELMGGRISVSSELGVGSVFQVVLPMAYSAEPTATSRAASELGHPRTLLVTSNATSREVLQKLLQSREWPVDCVASGHQARQQVTQANLQDKHYDVLLIDAQIADEDGLQTISALRSLLPDRQLPTILMVNAAGCGQLRSSERVDAILLKPVTSLHLFNALHEVLAGPAVRSAATPTHTPITLAGYCILLVEDNPLNQLVAKGLLSGAGATVDVLDNGALAVEHLRQNPERYDLVLMDVQMPVMDGCEATRLIRGTLGLKLPILAMSAGVLTEERDQCRASGMDDFIGKPIQVEHMFAVLGRNLAGLTGAPTLGQATQAEREVSADGRAVLTPDLLLQSAGDNPAMISTLRGVIQHIVDGGMSPIEEVRALCRDGQRADAARKLHTLRGGVGSLGAQRFVDAARHTEAFIRDGTDDSAPIDLTQVALEYRAILEFAAQWLQSGEPKNVVAQTN